MTRTVVALFDEFAQAKTAARDLIENGYGTKDISIITPATGGGHAAGPVDVHHTAPQVARGAAEGVVAGGVLGGIAGLLASAVAFALPGIGPVLAAGPLAAALAGTGTGAVAGGVLGGLVNMGIPEEDAHFFAEGLRRGGTLLTLHCRDDLAENAAALLRNNGAVDIDARRTDWRRERDTGVGINPEGTDLGLQGENLPPIREERPGDRERRGADFELYDRAFREHYDINYSTLGGRYEEYEQAYRYGYHLRGREHFVGRDWGAVEPDTQREWDRIRPGTWHRYREAIQYGWERGGERPYRGPDRRRQPQTHQP